MVAVLVVLLRHPRY